jgi:hypothetical protein
MNLIEEWARAKNLGPVNNPRRFAVTFDAVRVHLIEVHPGQLALEARLCDLPVQPNQRERSVERIMAIGLGRARESAHHVMLDEHRSAYWLQRRLPPGTQVPELETAVEELVNDVELWRKAL